MATNGQAEDGPTKGHNVGDTQKLIRNCAQEMTRIKNERRALNEEASDIRQRLREAEVQPKAFEFALRLYDQDQEVRDEYLDQLRVNFEALGIGGQGDLFPTPQEGVAPTFVQEAGAA